MPVVTPKPLPLTRPNRFLLRMAAFVIAVGALAGFMEKALVPFFLGNPGVNGVIIGILLAGIVYIFRQVILLNPEVTWIEKFRRNQALVSSEPMPRLLSPMATMLADRRGSRVTLSAVSLRTLLDGIATRLDETRETSRYLIGLLVFLGLLGTFYGLLETVQSVKGVIAGMSVSGGDAASAFAELRARLETPLGGMSTAFSASLFGLAGSLILGFLDLQAGLAQNRFYNDLEEWLSSYTRLSGGGAGSGELGETAVPAYIQALLEQTADSLDNLQRILSRGEESRIAANANLLALTDRLGAFTDQTRDEQSLLARLVEQQGELKPVLQRLADGASAARGDEARTHLRSIEIYLARMSEDMAHGRGELVQEIRSEIRLLARTIAALAEESERS